MSSKALSIVNNPEKYLPNPVELKETLEDLKDILSRNILGVITIAGGGAGVFKVLEPGAEDTTAVPQIEGVIIASHAMNVHWGHDFGTRQQGERPVCRSMDGKTGTDESGAPHDCEKCPFNQWGPDGQRKECTNKRQLYVLREGDLLPLLFALPPSALSAFDKYRVSARLTHGAPVSALITRITLKSKKSGNGIEYSSPAFEPVGKLPKDDAAAVERLARQIMQAAQSSGLSADDIMDEGAAPPDAPANGGMPLGEDEMPF